MFSENKKLSLSFKKQVTAPGFPRWLIRWVAIHFDICCPFTDRYVLLER